MLRPAAHFGVDTLGIQFFADHRDDFVDIFFAVGFFLRDVALELIVDLRMEMLERQILELAFNPGNSQAVRQRGVNIQGLLRGENLLFRRQMIESVRILCTRSASLIRITRTSLPIAKSILRKVFRLLLLSAAKIRPAQFGNTVD